MNPYRNKFEICIRAIILDKGRILVCRCKDKGYYFFPGGHLEFGEKIGDALTREIKEELNVEIKKFSFIGIVDNFFKEDGEKHHEINLIFDVKAKKISSRSRENHISFSFLKKKDFVKTQIYPIALKKSLLKWFRDKKIFWISQFPARQKN